MENFADQCIDMARSILGHNLKSIDEKGVILPITNEHSHPDEPGHAAFAIGEYYRATNETELDGCHLTELLARSITAQAFTEKTSEKGFAYSTLGLLSFGPSRERNLIWEQLLDSTQGKIEQQLLESKDHENHLQIFSIARAVTSFSLGLSEKDETGHLIDRFIQRIRNHSTSGFLDNAAGTSSRLGGAFDIYGIMSFVFIRQALQLHANIHLRESKLPSLRTHSGKYLKLLPDIVRQDGTGLAYGQSIGAYSQMHCISLILQALRDNWIEASQRDLYLDTVRRLFLNFFVTYLDQEHGYLVIRDEERNTALYHTTRMANFDAARYLCQWSRLARAIGGTSSPSTTVPARKVGRFVNFDKSHRKEQGLFLYQDPDSGLAFQLPLTGSSPQSRHTSDYLAFPHAPGIFDWPVDKYLPVMLPELVFGDKVVVPAFYGKRCTTSIGTDNSLVFKYDQPELITIDETFVNGLGSCKVSWTFQAGKINCEFCFNVRQQIQLDRMRYIIPIATSHSRYRVGTALVLGPEGHRTNVLKDDFQAKWKDFETVTSDLTYRTYYGNVHYLQILERDHPLVMRSGVQYHLALSFEPDIVFADE